MTLILNAQDVEPLCNMRVLIDAIERGLQEEASGHAVVPPRLNLPTANGFFRVMPAVMNASGLMVYKVFHGSMRGGVRYLIAVYAQEWERLLALMDAHYLTAARTGATTGVATKVLATPGAKTVAVIGSGLEARTNLQAVCAVRAVERVAVFSPNPERRARFAARMSAELGVEVRAVASPEQCVRGAEIVVVTTNSFGRPDPIAYRGAWMEPGVLVDAIGSTSTFLREIDTDTFQRAESIVVDSKVQVEEESGDVKAALNEGKYDRAKVRELKEVLAGKAQGRTRVQQMVLFKSVGTAVQDVMAGFAVYEEAVRQGRGQDIGEFLDLKTF
ncbi:MAG: ornithine cyclodeaminase family protein [Bryobacteraceae bacterium]|nr:ornithine cyclodeaminase family protein [Bryobacteraceae bacterium]